MVFYDQELVLGILLKNLIFLSSNKADYPAETIMIFPFMKFDLIFFKLKNFEIGEIPPSGRRIFYDQPKERKKAWYSTTRN